METRPLQRIRHVALDMDGTIYKGETLLACTPLFLKQLDELGIGHTFLTNNSSRSVADYVRHLATMGIEAGPEQVYTSTLSTIDYLRRSHPLLHRLYVLGTPSLQDEFAEAGFELVDSPEEAGRGSDQHVREPEAVIVGFDTGLCFPRLCKAAWWISRGKPFIATHPDRVCPTDLPTVLVDCGAVCACLESATGISPMAVLGKPDPRMLSGILERHGLAADELAMVGDRLYTDMAMARRSGALGVLVLTGETQETDLRSCSEPPDLVARDLEELGALLCEARGRGEKA